MNRNCLGSDAFPRLSEPTVKNGTPNATGVSLPSSLPCPVGTGDRSPTLQRWVETPRSPSPVGTTEEPLLQSSLRDARHTDAKPGVETPGYSRSSPRDELAQILVALEWAACQRVPARTG